MLKTPLLLRPLRLLSTLTLLGVLLGASTVARSQPMAPAPLAAPPNPPLAAPVHHVVKSPHGDRIDEFYWLRDDDPKTKRPEILRHLEAENAYTARWFEPLAGLRQQLVAEMRSRMRGDDSTPPAYRQGWWYWQQFGAAAEYPVLMRQRGGPEQPDPQARPQVVLDQPERARGKAYYAVGDWAVSPNGRLLAWTEDSVGRNTYTLRFKDLQTGRVLPDAIAGVVPSLAWANDNRSLFFIRQDPVTLQGGPVHRHTLGRSPARTAPVYEERDKTLFVGLERTASGRWVKIVVYGADTTETLAIPADQPAAAPRIVLARQPLVRHHADHHQGRWVLSTNEGAPDFRLVSAPEEAPDDRSRWQTLLPAREQTRLEHFALLDAGIAVQERVDATPRVRLLKADGRSLDVASAPGSVAELQGADDPAALHLRWTLGSMVQPQQTWDLHLRTGERVLRKQEPVPGYDATAYATERFWAPARDGARIPVTLAWRRDRAQADGRAPLLVTGYGSYGAPYDPTFSVERLSLLDRGFVVAIAHVRGGSELGEAWYAGGRLMNKMNTFTDFIDATDALVKAGWGAADQVFASGGSAGGLLMGAVANLAGDRYRGMVLDVPFVDVVTTMLDESIPLTANEWTQWGDPREKPAYDYMLGYSPYDRLERKAYPPMLVLTGLWDSQVQYYEPAKYVARLRRLKTDANPLLLHVNMSAGHGGASGRFERLDEAARVWAFYLGLLGRTRSCGPPGPACPPSALSGD